MESNYPLPYSLLQGFFFKNYYVLTVFLLYTSRSFYFCSSISEEKKKVFLMFCFNFKTWKLCCSLFVHGDSLLSGLHTACVELLLYWIGFQYIVFIFQTLITFVNKHLNKLNLEVTELETQVGFYSLLKGRDSRPVAHYALNLIHKSHWIIIDWALRCYFSRKPFISKYVCVMKIITNWAA